MRDGENGGSFEFRKTLRNAPDARQEAENRAAFDAVWPTPAVPEQDYCASLKEKPGAK